LFTNKWSFHMAKSHMPEQFFEEVKPLLPDEPNPSPLGGRPRVPHFTALRVIWFVLTSGCRWEDVPPEMGCSGRTAHRRLLDWQSLGIWEKLHRQMLTLLRQMHLLEHDLAVIDSFTVRSFGAGEGTGPSPVDRRKPGTKYTLMVDRNGVPLEMHSAPANASDQKQIIPIVLDFPRVGGAPGRPKERPDEVYADRGYDSDSTRMILAWLGVKAKIAKRRTPHGSGLGKVRWVVERTISWVKGLRRMRYRYDRLGVIRDAWAKLSLAVICFNIAYDTYNS
jgi:transposase